MTIFTKSKAAGILMLAAGAFFVPTSGHAAPERPVIQLETGERIALKNLFKQIEKSTDYRFVFSQEVDVLQTVEVKNTSLSIDELQKVLREQLGLNCNQQGNNILITPGTQKQKLTQNVKVKGVVLDNYGEPIIGATIVLKGTQQGGITDIEGKFSLNLEGVTAEDRLEVSFLGYEDSEVKLGNQSDFRIVLKEFFAELNEVVVVGYGEMEKKDVTGAVASVSGESLNDMATANFLDAAQGKVAGLDVNIGSAAPGQQMDIVIRGNSSITASNAPVVVVDGMPIEGGLNEINPNDIKSMEVLKDASSTAIYGSRGANGVILITTKRGKSGQTRVSVDSYLGVTSVSNKLNLMNGEEFAEMKREAYRTAGNLMPDDQLFDPIAYNNLQQGNYTDWQDLMYHNGLQQNHQISIVGGNDKLRTAVSGGFYEEQGIIDNYDFNRINLRTNIDYDAFDWLTVRTSTMFSSSTQNTGPGGQNIFDNIVRLNPLGDAYDEDGNILFRPTTDEGQRSNPLSDIENITNEIKNNRFLSNLYAEAKILPWLSYRVNLGLDYLYENSGAFYGSESSRQQGGNNRAEVVNRRKMGYMVDNILSAKKTWDDHKLNVTLMTGMQGENSTYAHIYANRIPNDDFLWHNIGSAEEIESVGSDYADWMLLSYMARVNYTFKDRYIFTVSSRRDGSSRFGDGYKYGLFPSAAFAWRIKEESFMQSAEWLDDLKLRVSYGAAGNTGIPPYQSLGSLHSSNYVYGDRGASGFRFQDLANPDLRWEKTASFNVGVDHSLWSGRISGSIEYYNSLTTDLLLERRLPASTGYESVLQNVGSVRNSGIEFNLNTVNVVTKDFRWNSNLNFSYNKNQVVDLYGTGLDDVGNAWFIGQPINVIYDHRKLGIWQLEEQEEALAKGFQPGELKVTEGREIIGYRDPQWIAGMTNSFSYKGWEFSFLLTGKFGYEIYSGLHSSAGRLDGRYNNFRQDYWTPDNPTNAYPRPDAATQGPKFGSSNNVFRGDFIRLKNVTLAYNFNAKQLERIGLKNLRIYAQAKNPAIWTEYEGYDPEFGTSTAYPAVSTYLMGINLSF
ncbi:TonB-dependent receptor [Persicobacter sp. CCB-QB2]|uniref:SusC/RagA family TonB-linked outer membrane protein n=1 Tax=Persicobacter sp. CCB-QB2 TaxID=1561025 RepID=UPI0006A948D5|nr:TonB-dependent receptor [Persicobacter sp. CCB-QB2]